MSTQRELGRSWWTSPATTMAPSHSETGRPALRCQERRSHFPLALIPLSVVAMMIPDEYGCDGDYNISCFLLLCLCNVHVLAFAVGKRAVVRVYHGGTQQQNATEWGGDANKVSVHSAQVWYGQADKPNKITRMCSMLMPNDAATSPPNAKPSSIVLQVLIMRPHCRECCSPTVQSCRQVFGLQRWMRPVSRSG